MIRYIPMAEWEEQLYKVLTSHIVGYEIFNTVAPLDTEEPIPERWATIGAYTCAPSSAKADVANFRVTSTIHAWCKGQNKQKLNEMLNDIVQSASYGAEAGEYELEHFVCHSVDFAMVEAFEVDFDSGESGQHGVVRITADLQQKYI